jgi:hypothetical protein
MSPTENATALAVPLAERTSEEIRATLAPRQLADLEVQALLDLHEYAVREGLSISGLGLRMRQSAGTISAWFSGTYPAGYARAAQKIRAFLVAEEKRALYSGVEGFCKTAIAGALWKIFERTRYSKRIQVVQSEEQIGKSTAAREYAHANNHGRTLMVTCPETESSSCCSNFIRNLAQASGVGAWQKMSMIRYQIPDAIAGCDLVLIDEAHMIKNWSDRAVRSFLDYLRITIHADGVRGVVMMATNEDLIGLIATFRKRSRYNIGQLLGRMCNQVLSVEADEIPISDVELFVSRYYKPGARCIGKLHDVVCRPGLGHFGLLKDVLNRAWSDAKVDRATLNDALVLTTLEATLEDIASRKDLYV